MSTCSVDQSPIVIQNEAGKDLPENGLQCSLTCQMSFDYARPQWQVSAVNVAQNDSKKLLRFYVTNINNPVQKDIVFNGRDYQLEFVEFYVQALHKIPVEGQTTDYQYPVEMVMYHSSKLTPSTPSQPSSTEWLAVSVFVLPQNSYSLSNTFFYQLLNTTLVKPTETNTYVFNSDVLEADSAQQNQYMNVSWNTPTTTVQSVLEGKAVSASSSPAIQIQVGQFWSPYQSLPANKAFYSYTGSFPYNSELAASNYNAENTFTWVLMKNPVSMYQGEYVILQSLYQNDSFYWNLSQTYEPCVPENRNIMYNDGALVGGNADQDKFYVKCVNKESDAVGKTFTQEEEIQQLQELSNPSLQSAIFTTYQPPTSTMSAIVFCAVFGVVFFAMFAASSWLESSSSDSASADGVTGMQHSIIALLCISLFVLYGMSFATATWMVGAQPLAMLFWLFLLMCWTRFAMPKLNSLMYKNFYAGSGLKGAGHKMLGFLFGCASYGPYGLILLAGLTSIVLNPMFNLNGAIVSTYSYYYTDAATNKTNPTFYIGVKASTLINFSGFQLNYRNLNGVGSEDNLFVPIPIEFYNPQKGDETSTPPVPPTKPQFMNYNTSPSLSEFTNTPSVGNTINQTDPNPSTQNIQFMTSIMDEYNANMFKDHTNPFKTFVSAVWKILTGAGIYPTSFYTTTNTPDTPLVGGSTTVANPPILITSLMTMNDVATQLASNGLPSTATQTAGIYYDLVTLLTSDFPESKQYAEAAQSGS